MNGTEKKTKTGKRNSERKRRDMREGMEVTEEIKILRQLYFRTNKVVSYP